MGWFWLGHHSQWPCMLWAGCYCLQLLLDQLHNSNTKFHGVGGGLSRPLCSHSNSSWGWVEVELGCDNYTYACHCPAVPGHVRLITQHMLNQSKVLPPDDFTNLVCFRILIKRWMNKYKCLYIHPSNDESIWSKYVILIFCIYQVLMIKILNGRNLALRNNKKQQKGDTKTVYSISFISNWL